MYRNEKDCGTAVLDFLASVANTESLRREHVHYTSKLASNSTYHAARNAIRQSVRECGLGYIDLFLLHSPYGGKKARLESWRAVEDAIEDGEIKTGGVSNYGVKHVCTTLYTSALASLDIHLNHGVGPGFILASSLQQKIRHSDMP